MTSQLRKLRFLRTTCPTRAHGTIAGVIRVATDVPHSCVQETFAVEVLAEEVFHAPEATSRDGTFLGIRREILGLAAFGVEGHAGGGGEGAEEAIEEVGHCGSHEDG